MVDAAQLPEYLQSSSSLIKALKAPRDPPQPDWPSKIEIAWQAHKSEELFLYRKQSLLRDWVIEEFVKVRGAKFSSSNPLLDYRYHDLLETISHGTDPATFISAPVQTILQGFFSTLCANVHKVQSLGRLVDAAARSCRTLLATVREDRSATAGKAEGWLEILGLMLTWIDKENIKECLVSVEQLLRAVGAELVVSLDVAQNRKKITSSIQPLAPALLSAWEANISIRHAIEDPFKALAFSLPILQQEDVSTAYLLPTILYHHDILPQTKLCFLPRYLALLIASIHQNRYALFPPTASSRSSVPLDVHVSGRVRQAVLQCTRFVLDSINKIASPASDQAARCNAIALVWQAVQTWGGYLEGDTAWSSLLQESVSETAKDLEGADAALAGAIYEVMETAASLDYGATQLSAEIVSDMQTCSRNVLAHAISVAEPSNSDRALKLLLTVTRYHALTHENSGLLELLCDSVAHALRQGDARSTYRHICCGPLVSSRFRQKYERIIIDTLAGGGLSGGWVTMLSNISGRLERCCELVRLDQTHPEGSIKKRRINDGSAVPSSSIDGFAAEFGILSRLASILFDTVVGSQVDKFASVQPTVDQYHRAWHRTLSDASTGPSRTWADKMQIAGLTRLLRSCTRFKDTVENVELPALTGYTLDDEAAAELRYERCSAAFESAEKLGFLPQTDEIAMETFLTPADDSNAVWSGLSGEVQGQSLSAAVWQNIAMQGVPVIEAYATDRQVDLFAQSLVHRGAKASRLEQGGFCASRAIERVMCSSELWEMPRLQTAISRHIRALMIVDMPQPSVIKNIFTFLMLTPVEYLSRNLRNVIMAKAYEWDIAFARSDERWEESALLRRYLSRTIAETGYIGNLETDNIDVLLKSRYQSSTRTDESTRDLFSELLSSLLREAKLEKNSGLLAYLVVKLVNDINRHQNLGPICAILLTTPNKLTIDPDSLPSHVLGSLDELYRKMGRVYEKQFQNGDVTEELLSIYRALAVYSSWRQSDTVSVSRISKGLAQRAVHSCLQQLADGEASPSSHVVELAIPALETLAIEIASSHQTQTDMQTWLAAWIAIKAAFVRSSGIQEHSLMEQVYRRSLSRIDSATYGSLLSTLMDTLCTPLGAASPIAGASLTACLLLLELQINNSGKIFKQHLSRLLALLHACIAMSKETDLCVQALQIMNMISERKPVSLSEQDASEIALASFAALAPSSASSAQTNLEVPTLVLSICNSLVRHRRDLILNILPQLMRIYSRMFGLFAYPRASVGSGKLRSIVISRRPKWMGPEDSDCLRDQEASAFARAIGTLTGRSTIRRGKSTNESTPGNQLDRDLGSLVGQLSKHAPGVLVAYVRAVADPLCGLPQTVRGELEPGLFALCEAITAGGKAQFGKGPGEGVGEAFGLGEGDNADTEYEVWVDLWQKWTNKRYTGQG